MRTMRPPQFPTLGSASIEDIRNGLEDGLFTSEELVQVDSPSKLYRDRTDICARLS